ncbi:MAG: FAD-dependent oxidoreductase, partial [Verrucomicrobia bacterium]|nr:FAD-dependent oxidoreductase [Verrucomicrobiota bacterium]
MSKAVPLVYRLRPGDPDWPTEAVWDRLRRDVLGNLVKVCSPFAELTGVPPASDDCEEFFRKLKNPYYLGDESGLTQTLGWIGAWTSQPSIYAVAARSTADVVAAVIFAREHRLRLVIKGGGHSYQGTSNASDSLLIWTRNMNRITVHEMFVCSGCEDQATATPAVTVEAGVIWGQVYDAVVSKAGRYVQGGGCLTVGVAGLVQSGGFGSFSKAYGLACGSLLEAEIVTADGVVRTVNRQMEPDLFWGIKGGGGGSLGVITRLTLKTHLLPNFFGRVQGTISAKSDDAFRELIRRVVRFYRGALFNSHWGEQIALRSGNILEFNMVFQGLDQKEAEDIWRPLLDWVVASTNDLAIVNPIRILAAPARRRWDPEYLRQ